MDIITKKELLFEPRAFWDQVSARTIVPSTAVVNNFTRVTVGDGRTFNLPRANFTNGSRYPIDLTKMSICPLGYMLRRYAGTLDPINPTPIAVYNDMSWLSLTAMRIRAPKRAGLQSFAFSPGSIPSDPTSDGGMGPLTTQPVASNLLGLSRWDFERPCKLVRNGVIRYDMMPLRWPYFNNNITDLPPPDVSMAFFESDLGGSRLGGFSRNKTIAQVPRARRPMVFPTGPTTTTVDYYDQLQVGAGDDSGWPPVMSFDASNNTGSRYRFRAQETTRGAYASNVDGYAIMLRQIYWDEGVQALNRPPGAAGSPLSSLSSHIGARCKTIDGGTNEWWWRPGAPIALVTPTITPALVVTLPKTITLGPGESLEVEVLLPPAINFPNASPQATSIQPMYNLGISFTGYATIEG